MAFSGALTLTDLNDYLGPSQACIKPVSGKDAPSTEQKEVGAASTEIAIDADGEYYESTAGQMGINTASIDDKPRARTRLETAEISLNDCLACSGCVTSAESVLIGMQSVDELRKAAEKKGTSEDDAPTHIVVSISPQSLASLSAKYSRSLADPLPLQTVLDRVEHFLKSKMQVDIVIDTSFARHMSLAEQAKEFRERKEEGLSSTQPTLPMLASACPGWICYAEKTHGELIPLISKTRSPQQIAGILAKRYLVESGGLSSSERVTRVYHTTVMPCYDKKLEASRQDFFDDVTQSRDVDLVITTGELDDLMQAESFNLASSIEKIENDVSMTPPDSLQEASVSPGIPSLFQQPGSSSGSYLFDLIRRVWVEYLEESQESASSKPFPKLAVKMIRSADYTEYVLYAQDGSGKILFKGAQCYGFRNLQNLVRKVQRQTGLKSKKAAAGSLLDGPSTLNSERRSANGLRGRGRGGMVRRGRGGLAGRSSTTESSPLARSDAAIENVMEDEESRAYDFVEVMACPGGCVNGGGQIRPPGQANGSAGSSALTARTITADTLDPEGYTSGWSTPPLSVSGTSEGNAGLDGEGPSTPMELDETNEPAVQGWKGTSKEWVKRVEYLYWRALKDTSEDEMIGNIHQAQALGVSREQIDKRISNTIQRAAANLAASASLDILAEQVIQTICKKQKRSDILRTQYRALQDEAVSGLAVQW
ncbi:iron hydrogenase [Meira miltonrushii]|uniref:Cytosolic Fe-S cluster assembly factor NAR1 n=1 Tax=Meira miltonrushii TaxID=1280837 RepID=A0A316VFQ7_9BASI|nr:iron hydrogenase [Meira miltonrushii]PWN34315.1 iron hydrogenase [Meira miltonrushii]